MGSSSAKGSGLEQILYAPKGVMSGLKTLAWWLFPRDPITGAYLPPEQAPWYMPMQPYQGLLPGQQPIPPEFTQSLQNIMDLQRWLSPTQSVTPTAAMNALVGPLGQATNIVGAPAAVGHITDVLRPAPATVPPVGHTVDVLRPAPAEIDTSRSISQKTKTGKARTTGHIVDILQPGPTKAGARGRKAQTAAPKPGLIQAPPISHMTEVYRPIPGQAIPSQPIMPTEASAQLGSPLALMSAPLSGAEDFLGMTRQMAEAGAGMAKQGMDFLRQAAGVLFPIAQGSLTKGLEQAAERYYQSLKPLLGRDIAQALEMTGLGGARYSSGAQRALSDVEKEFYSNYMANLMQAAQTGAELQTRAALGTPEFGRGAASLAGAMANLGGLGLGGAGIEADIANMLGQTALDMGRLGAEASRLGMSGAQTMWEMTGQGLAAPYQEYLRQSYYPMEIMQTLVSALRPRQVKQQSSSSAKGGCCFIFLEAYDGKLPWVVRAYRDQHMTPKNRRGYYRLADKLVPLMRKSRAVKHLVRFLMTKPMTFYGKYFYKLNPWGALAAPITAFWLLVFDLIGRKASYVRSNGEVV